MDATALEIIREYIFAVLKEKKLNSLLPCSFKVQDKLNTTYPLDLKHYSVLGGTA